MRALANNSGKLWDSFRFEGWQAAWAMLICVRTQTTPMDLPPNRPGLCYGSTYRKPTIPDAERWMRLTTRSRGGASRFRGVSRHSSRTPGLWRAQLTFRGQRTFIGTFSTEEEAALAWNRTVLNIVGPDAKPVLNDVEEPLTDDQTRTPADPL